MHKRKIATISSLIYCGLGQIYKGEVGKGIVFIMIYTLLIFFTLFTRPWSLINSIGLPVLILMWIAGTLDAYIYSKDTEEDESPLQLVRPILVGTAITLFFIVLGLSIMLQPLPKHERSELSQVSVTPNKDPYAAPSNHTDTVVSEGVAGEQPDQQYPDTPVQKVVEPDSSLIQPNVEEGADSNAYISIQVGAFSIQDEAERLAESLRKKGYSVEVVVLVASDTQKLYKVRVGKFQSEGDALRIAQILSKNEGVPTILVPVTE